MILYYFYFIFVFITKRFSYAVFFQYVKTNFLLLKSYFKSKDNLDLCKFRY